MQTALSTIIITVRVLDSAGTTFVRVCKRRYDINDE